MKLVVNVDLVVEGSDDFIRLLGEVLTDRKKVNYTDDLSIWEHDPETIFKSATIDSN